MNEIFQFLCLQEPVEDIYPLQIVDDLENGIRGSCSTYKTRTNITHSIRSADNSMLLSYKEVMERYVPRNYLV